MNTLSPQSSLASGAAAVWIAGASLRARLYRAGILRQRRLRAPVVSIGNLAWGGTGKTPFCIWLTRRLQAEGLRVSLLTRGYGRASRERVKVLPPNATPESARGYGDEVQLFLRHLHCSNGASHRVPIGIGDSRYEAGRALEELYPVDVHLLDDGFQHLALARDIDLVLIDASNPWGARGRWPLLLREGFSSLRRAHAVLLTRCELAERSGGRARLGELQASIRSFNPDAPCFIMRTALRGFPLYGEEPALDSRELPPQPAFAFCALGNHQSFFSMLSGAGLSLAGKLAFADHHRYNQEDVETISKRAAEARAACLITTEKDLVNLPPRAAFPLPLRWAAIEPEIENADELIGWILGKLPALARSAASAGENLASSGRDSTPDEASARRDSAEHGAPPLAT
jgi:tetraacyldisaccharide 4'-kinase